jgi:hypothetical protein
VPKATCARIPAPTIWTTASALGHALLLHQEGSIDDALLIAMLPQIHSEPDGVAATWPELLQSARDV